MDISSPNTVVGLEVNTKNITPYLASCKTMLFSENITSLYPTAYIETFLPSYLIEEGTVAVGSDAIFSFFNTETGALKTQKKYKIWKIQIATTDTLIHMSGLYQITFIHPWFFLQKSRSKAYKDSVANTLRYMILDEMYELLDKFYVDDSIDPIVSQYRTYQTMGEFIENRLTGYVVDNSPTFIFVNSSNEFHAHSFLNMLKIPTDNKIIHLPSYEIITSKISASMEKDRLLVPLAINYSLNASGNIWHRLNSKTKFLYPTGSSSSEKTISGDTSSFNPTGFLPLDSSIKNIDYVLSTYLDDTQRKTSIIYSSFTEKQKELLNDQTFSITCYPNFTIKIGEAIDLYLKKEDVKGLLSTIDNSLFFSSYLIKSIQHISVEGTIMTKLELTRDMIQPKDSKTLVKAKNTFQL